MDVNRLNEAFDNFTMASKSLETYYGLLQERISYLTMELETRNQQLRAALADADRNRDYLTAILYNLEEAIIVVDPEERVTMMNRSAEGLLLAAHADAMGKPFSGLNISFRQEGAETLLDVQGKQFNIILSRSDIIDSDGRLRGRVILIKDITRLRELEVRHERNQRLIAMGEMAARIVHEIRNPLCSIELYSSMLAKELTSTQHRELATGISSGISNLNTILTNMLFFARPHKPAFKTIRLDRVIDEALRMLQPLMDSRKVRLVKSLREQELYGDAELLKQAVLNIAINAVQAMPDGGRVEVAMMQDAKTAVVTIKDSGAGIPREDLEKIFDPFFTTKDTGTGLGLAITSSIMQANNGYVKVSSEPGAGSAFSLIFPVAEKRPHEDSETNDGQWTKEGMTENQEAVSYRVPSSAPAIVS